MMAMMAMMMILLHAPKRRTIYPVLQTCPNFTAAGTLREVRVRSFAYVLPPSCAMITVHSKTGTPDRQAVSVSKVVPD